MVFSALLHYISFLFDLQHKQEAPVGYMLAFWACILMWWAFGLLCVIDDAVQEEEGSVYVALQIT